MNISGKITVIFDTAQINDSFKKREFVLEYSDNSQFTELIKFELFQDKCDLINDFKVGDEVGVEFNLKGRKWTDPKGVDKYFTTLQAWKLDKTGGSPAQDNATNDMSEPEWLADKEDNGGDLPF
jgi:hypothetical protein